MKKYEIDKHNLLDIKPALTEEMKISYIKKAINSEEGWKALAISLGHQESAKEECVRILRKIGNDKIISIPVVLDNGMERMMETNLSDFLEQELNKYLNLLVLENL